MKKALNAFIPAEKMYNVQRIHSKLIYLSQNRNAINDIFSEGQYSVDMILNSLELAARCFINDNDCKKANRRLKNYLQSIEQTRRHIHNYRNGKWNARKLCFCYMAGMFALLHHKTKNKIHKFCEFEYQGICVPMYKLDKKYIKNNWDA